MCCCMCYLSKCTTSEDAPNPPFVSSEKLVVLTFSVSHSNTIKQLPLFRVLASKALRPDYGSLWTQRNDSDSS